MLIVFLGVFMLAQPAWSETIALKSRISDSFPTNTLGTSLNAPPNIQVIRSKRGAEYFIARYRQLNNRASYSKLRKLKKQLDAIDFSKYMVITVLSRPMDNYKVKIKKVKLEKDIIVVKATYKHQLKNYSIPPKKSIFYTMAVVKKMNQPVLLEASKVKVKSKVRQSKKITVTGRLMPFSDRSIYQLVPVKIKRGKKHSYYISGAKAKELSRYVGKVITLAGTVSHERNGPYERDLKVDRLVKSYE